MMQKDLSQSDTASQAWHEMKCDEMEAGYKDQDHLHPYTSAVIAYGRNGELLKKVLKVINQKFSLPGRIIDLRPLRLEVERMLSCDGYFFYLIYNEEQNILGPHEIDQLSAFVWGSIHTLEMESSQSRNKTNADG